MSGSRATWLAARREIRERLRSRAYRVSTLVQVLAVVALAVVVSVTGGDGSTNVKVGTVGENGKTIVAQADRAAGQFNLEFETTEFDDAAAARSALVDGDIEAAVGDGPVLVVSDTPEQAQAVLGQAAGDSELMSRLKSAGVPAEQSVKILDANRVSFETVDTGDDGGEGIGFITTLLLYLALILCGYAVASGVTEEKSTRVVELIINAIKPRNLLAGKVAGIGLIGLLQLLLVVIAGLGTALVMGEIDLPEATFETAGLGLLYFVLGFAFYGCAFAVAGSIVSRQEDSQSTTTPVMLILAGAYVLSISATSEPSSTIAVVGTLVPPIAPLIVPARAAAGELPLDQLIASLVLMIAGCVLLIWLAGRVYERAVLRMGAPLKLRDLLGMLR
ncbi:MAG: ABC transporter permease [Actinomycetota bacterium]|nr:ABC transporter permease [Actinomycetota bacterium]